MREAAMQRAWTIAVLCGVLAGCWSWRTGGLAPEHMIAQYHPRQVRILFSPNQVAVLQNPRVESAHIVGIDAQTAAPRSVPLTDIKEFQVWAPDGGETALLVGSIVAVVGGLVFAVIMSGLSGG